MGECSCCEEVADRFENLCNSCPGRCSCVGRGFSFFASLVGIAARGNLFVMTPTLLHAVTAQSRSIHPRRRLARTLFMREQDNFAFEELLRRHGPLVWAICRQMLPHHADAEDAFKRCF